MADNVIRVNVTTVAPKSISIQGSREQNYINATGDTSGYNAQLAKNWAIGEGKIQGIDYSSKHYAGVAQGHAETVANTLDIAQDIINNFDGNISSILEVVSSAKDEAVADIEASKDGVINDVVSAGETTLASIDESKTVALEDLSVKKSEIIADLEVIQTNKIKELDTKGTEVISISNAAITELEEKATSATNTVDDSLQEYIEISEQIKAENSKSSKLAKEWAISETIVENIDYSAKYWAEKAKDNSGIYYDEVGEETIDVDILEAGYVTTGKLEETVGDISTLLDDILGEEN